MKRIHWFFAVALVPLCALLGCGRNGDTSDTRFKVVCTTGMIADVVRNIGDEFVTVEQLMADGVDPHTYKVTSGDVNKMNAADIVFYSGLHLEGKMTDTLERMARKKSVIAVAERIEQKWILTDEHKHPDPHVWFDVSLWSEVAGAIGDALAKHNPTNADVYKKKTEIYRARLARLHEETKETIASIEPKEKRVLITSHDAFRYFGRAYDIEVKGIQGISTDAEASVRDINNLVDFIAARKVKAVFVESSVSPRNMKSLQEGCKARGHEVALGGELFSDAMGAEGTQEGTYIGMIRHNAETIAKALK